MRHAPRLVQAGDREPGTSLPWVVANALIGVHRALIDYVRRQTLAGARAADLARDYGLQAERALARLEQGLEGEYGFRDVDPGSGQ